jgi:hypothetical protein
VKGRRAKCGAGGRAGSQPPALRWVCAMSVCLGRIAVSTSHRPQCRYFVMSRVWGEGDGRQVRTQSRPLNRRVVSHICRKFQQFRLSFLASIRILQACSGCACPPSRLRTVHFAHTTLVRDRHQTPCVSLRLRAQHALHSLFLRPRGPVCAAHDRTHPPAQSRLCCARSWTCLLEVVRRIRRSSAVHLRPLPGEALVRRKPPQLEAEAGPEA